MAKQEDEQGQQNFTLKDVMSLLDQISKQSDERMLTLVSKMKEPTAAEQKKIDESEALIRRKHEIRRSEMIAEEKSRLGAQRSCPHKKKHARSGAFISAWGGQVNADGYWHPVCTVCMKEGPEVKAPIEWIQGGVNATDPENVYMASLTEEILLEWQKRLGGPKPKTRPAGWTEKDKKELAAV